MDVAPKPRETETQFAFDEFQQLASSSKPEVLRYVCALVAELTYYHVPQFEVDSNGSENSTTSRHQKRAKVVPCEAYAEIIKRGVRTDVVQLFQGLEINPFVIVDRGIVAVGIPMLHQQDLFIGFRGTRFMFDWKVNLNAKLVEFDSMLYPYDPHYIALVGYRRGRVHSGYGEEALRITPKIVEKTEGIMSNVSRIFLVGHSLGGAVAAIIHNILSRESCWRERRLHTLAFGAPRYCDAGYFSLVPDPPQQIQRRNDVVPLVPPKCMGYVDHTRQSYVDGSPVLTPMHRSRLHHFRWLSSLFLHRSIKQHSIERYRKELGQAANAILWRSSLTSCQRLRRK